MPPTPRGVAAAEGSQAGEPEGCHLGQPGLFTQGLKVGRWLGAGGTAFAEALRPERLEGSEPIRKDRANGVGSQGGGDGAQGWGARVSAREDRRGWGPSGKGELSSRALSSNHTPSLAAAAGRGQTPEDRGQACLGEAIPRDPRAGGPEWGLGLSSAPEDPLGIGWRLSQSGVRTRRFPPGLPSNMLRGGGRWGQASAPPGFQQGVPAGISQTLLRVGTDAGVGGSPVI